MNVKEKIATERRSAHKTGGGPPEILILAEDEFASSFKGNEAFEGIKGGKHSSILQLSGVCRMVIKSSDICSSSKGTVATKKKCISKKRSVSTKSTILLQQQQVLKI
jgi:hypothetical protein